jgi:hypothetical protein
MKAIARYSMPARRLRFIAASNAYCTGSAKRHGEGPPIVRSTSYIHSASRFEKATTIEFGGIRPAFTSRHQARWEAHG